MANDMKSGIGFIIPAAGVVGFFTSLLMGEFLLSIIIAVAGILVWFLYMLVMESRIPDQMGNMILLFGVMLAIGILFGFGMALLGWLFYRDNPEECGLMMDGRKNLQTKKNWQNYPTAHARNPATVPNRRTGLCTGKYDSLYFLKRYRSLNFL